METVADFIFLGSKITVDGDCSHEIKRRLLLGRKVMTNLDSILKSRDITLPTKEKTLMLGGIGGRSPGYPNAHRSELALRTCVTVCQGIWEEKGKRLHAHSGIKLYC